MKFFFLPFCLFLGFASLSLSSEEPFVAKDFSHLLKETSFSQSLIKMHLQLYQGYVKNTNTLCALLNDLLTEGKGRSLESMALQRRVGWEYNGMRLHELYFEGLGKSAPLTAKSSLYEAISLQFTGFERWKQAFMDLGMTRGIGWVILFLEPKQKRLINVWVDEHDTGVLAQGIPLLVMDVWEHAYITEFGLKREEYIHTFFENINWNVIENRFKEEENSFFSFLEKRRKKHNAILSSHENRDSSSF